MDFAEDILNGIESHLGRKLDLNNHRDRCRFFGAIQREVDKKDLIVGNIQNVLNGYQTYDANVYKTILDRNRIGN